MSEIRKFGVTVPISDLTWYEPGPRLSDEERAELAQQREERLAETRIWLDKMATIRRPPLILKLLELHHADENGTCDGCDMDGYECDNPEWPCRTVRLIAKHFSRPAPEWVELP